MGQSKWAFFLETLKVLKRKSVPVMHLALIEADFVSGPEREKDDDN